MNSPHSVYWKILLLPFTTLLRYEPSYLVLENHTEPVPTSIAICSSSLIIHTSDTYLYPELCYPNHSPLFSLWHDPYTCFHFPYICIQHKHLVLTFRGFDDTHCQPFLSS